jgi:hypothetical protein
VLDHDAVREGFSLDFETDSTGVGGCIVLNWCIGSRVILTMWKPHCLILNRTAIGIISSNTTLRPPELEL